MAAGGCSSLGTKRRSTSRASGLRRWSLSRSRAPDNAESRELTASSCLPVRSMPRVSAPSRRDSAWFLRHRAVSARLFPFPPSTHRGRPGGGAAPSLPISMRHRHPLEFRQRRSTATRHMRTIMCAGSQVARVRLPRGRLTRDDASNRESKRELGDGLSASRSAHRRWLADGPGRATMGGWFGCAALWSDANVAVPKGGRTDAVGPSRQAGTHGPGVPAPAILGRPCTLDYGASHGGATRRSVVRGQRCASQPLPANTAFGT